MKTETFIFTKESQSIYMDKYPHSLLWNVLFNTHESLKDISLVIKGNILLTSNRFEEKLKPLTYSNDFKEEFLLRVDEDKTELTVSNNTVSDNAGKDASALGAILTSRGSDKYEEVMNLHGLLLNNLTKASNKADTLSPQNLAYFAMISHKLARLACGYGDNIDNLLDIAGYSQLQAGDK